jgi:hypothetical protein
LAMSLQESIMKEDSKNNETKGKNAGLKLNNCFLFFV